MQALRFGFVMSELLSNSLTELSDRIAAANTEMVASNLTAAHAALVTGALLVEAKDACRHGEWLPLLKRSGVAERQAQRLMALARPGFTSDIVSDLGGIAAALKMASAARMPTLDEQLIVFASWEDHEFVDGHPPPGGVALVHRDPEHPQFLFVDGYDLSDDGSYGASVTSRRPMLEDHVAAGEIRVSMVWLSIHAILGKQLSRSEAFVSPRHGWSAWIGEFNQRRTALV